jgi:hypothetical protein
VLNRAVENFLEALLGEGRTLHVSDGLDVGGQLFALSRADGGEALVSQTFEELRVVAQINFGAYQEVVGGTVVRDFRPPLRLNVLEGGLRDH